MEEEGDSPGGEEVGEGFPMGMEVRKAGEGTPLQVMEMVRMEGMTSDNQYQDRQP
jgi:hypothetical protein